MNEHDKNNAEKLSLNESSLIHVQPSEQPNLVISQFLHKYLLLLFNKYTMQHFVMIFLVIQVQPIRKMTMDMIKKPNENNIDVFCVSVGIDQR